MGGCGGGAHTCYPPAVNYTPLYYTFNGVAFNKTNVGGSVFSVTPSTGVSGNVLVRFVNAGLRMHVPSIVGALTNDSSSGTLKVVSGVSLIAEDGNVLPGNFRVQSEVFLPAGKTYDVMINAPAAGAPALPVFDRELSLSANKQRDGGMLAYIGVNGSGAAVGSGISAPSAAAVSYYCIPGVTLSVLDQNKGVLGGLGAGAYGAILDASTPATGANGTISLNPDGTFTYTPASATATACGDTFRYDLNGSSANNNTLTITQCLSTNPACFGKNPIAVADVFPASNLATKVQIAPPGVLANDTDPDHHPLTAVYDTAACTPTIPGSLPLTQAQAGLNADGSFTAAPPSSGNYYFCYHAMNSQKSVSSAVSVQITAPTPSNLAVTVLDGTDKTTVIGDYRWIIEEDRTFYIDPKCTANPPAAGCPTVGAGIVPTFGTNFHTSYMPLVAAGCTGPLSCEGGQTIYDPTTGTHVNAVCDIGNGICRPDPTGNGQAIVLPSQVHLDPNKRYYFSILPGDAAYPFESGNATPGHGMGGAPIPAVVPPATTFAPLTVYAQPTPFPPSKLSVFVFEDDFPLNGEHDGSGGVDVLAVNEPGLGGFNITLFDDAGGTGDATGQMTYDMFNQPLSNSLAGTIDPATGLDACPISASARLGVDSSNGNTPGAVSPTGITGTIVTCPKFEAGGNVLSPLAGQAVIANLMPGRYGVVATPAADRIARGEEWLQTNTLDGQKAHDSFLRIGEPSYFQEFGPAGYHVSIGFANPKIINGRLAGICGGTDPNLTGSNCHNTVTGTVTTERMSRTPDERLYSSGDNSSFAFTQCYVTVGDTDGEDFAFTKCDANGTFNLTGIPNGNWRVTVFDQWNDMLVDGLSTPVGLGTGFAPCPGPLSNASTCDMGQIATNQWQANIYTKTFFDLNGNGIQDSGENGLTLVSTNIRFRDGSYSNFNNTDLAGNAGFNEIFPLFSWYVVETDSTRYKNTGTHVVYDAGGPSDGTTGGGTSAIGNMLANTVEQIPVPSPLRVPGARYCANADCPAGDTAGGSTGRIDPAWVSSEGWQGFSGQNSFIEFGKKPYVPGENGGIRGEVIYASTRPFDDPQLLLHTSWTPDVPGVTINLYQEGTAKDGSQSLQLVDTTKTSSWDAWAQGFHLGADGVTQIPNMNCPGQGTASGTNADLFFFSLFNQPMWLDLYNSENGGPAPTPVPNNSQFKCYDGMHNWNQIQPAPYDGYYTFPSVTSLNPATGKPAGTNCTICLTNPDASDAYRYGNSATPIAWTAGNGAPMLPAGKYVVEMIVPPGYELVKEEDKNILIGDNYIAPVTQQFGGLGGVYILPDQAAIGASYNPNNAQNPTTDLGTLHLPRGEGDTGSVEQFWPCVGASRIVPDYMSIFPQSAEVAPFAGATRNLCDRKEVNLTDQVSVLAKFWVFSSTHVAAHFTGVITDDFTSEFDPFSPQFGEKFSPANMPISLKDWTGTEVSRVYSDHWGTYNGLTYSTWEVNPPNPTGYAPTMMVTCMNDPGNGPTPDPLFNPSYSQFCYEIPFMPGQTQYMDTPVIPTSAFAGAGYNNVDCAYPNVTPAISEVDGDGLGPWVSASGSTLTITALGDQTVNNYGYSGPSATTPPFNQKTVTRHYGFGNRCTSPTPGSATCNTVSKVTIGGVTAPLTGTGWGDGSIQVTVPAGVANCAIQQQQQYAPGATSAQCGELVITAGNGKQSIDAVTVTIGGKAPHHVLATDTVQSAIDGALPGDLLMVDPAVHNELLVMWKPVRLQGVGAASSVINANTHPAGKLDPWRAQINCLFGLALNGQPYSNNTTPVPPSTTINLYDPTGASNCPGTGWQGFSGGANNPQVDRLPLEGIVGWDTTVNGNLAELLQEPSLMGAYEGAGITVLGKGVRFPADGLVFGNGADTGTIATESQMPLGTVELTSADCTGSIANPTDPTNQFPSNFQCNPSSIDGLSITDSSQGGGGIFAHAWAHNLEIANNRIYNNSGTQSGGINIGQGESPDQLLAGNNGDPVGFDQQPWTCVPGAVVNGVQIVSPPGFATNQQLPFCYNLNVNVHHNAITSNSSIGDELFSATPAGAGGATFCTGADYYKFNYNWVCGNLSTGDGGGLAHLGFIYNGDIEHNSILFNQSTNPTIPTNGGGLIIMGAAPDGTPSAGAPECGSVTDVDCAPGLSEGSGPGLVVNANLIMGNAAESGSGGGMRLQSINGKEVGFFPTSPSQWYSVNVTNNIIANNVAGWDGGGVSLQDALAVNFINNTVMSNDTTASAGVLFNTLGAPLASSTGTNCIQIGGTTNSCPQPAGLVSVRHSSPFAASLASLPAITCPTGHGNSTQCRQFSLPILENDVFWQNRAFYIGVGSLGAGTLNQQHVVALYNAFTTTQASSQPLTGACDTGTSYWDIGVRGDTGPTNHSGGITLTPRWSVLTSITGGYNTTGLFNTASNPLAISQYCNGSRVPPENGGLGYQVPPGISDATVPNPIFNLTPAATVDEGNNWINISWGPLSMTNPVNGAQLGNYSLQSSSPSIDYIQCASAVGACLAQNELLPAPTTDFFGNPRPNDGDARIDVGAVEHQGDQTGALAPHLDSINPSTGLRGTTVKVVLSGTNLTGTTAINGLGGGGVTVTLTSVNATTVTATLVITSSASLTPRTVSVTSPSGTSNTVTFTVVGATLTSISPTTGARGTTVPVTLTGTHLTGTTAITVSGTGVTVSGVTVVNDTTVTANFTITTGATLGARNVTATTPAGTSTAVTFTVVGPALTGIAPNSGARGTAVPVTITGTNLTGTTAVTVSGSGVAVSGITVNSGGTQVTATFTITTGATLSARNVTVTTNGAASNAVTFTVVGPTLTSIAPTSHARNSSFAVTLTGTNLTGTTAVAVSGTGVTASGISVNPGGTQVTATFTITAGAGTNARTVSTTTNGATSNTVTFTVTP
jgi:hypothetical protein